MSDTVNHSSETEAVIAEAQAAVGQLLRQTREKGGVDIAEAARSLRINLRYLEALEDSRNQDLPGTTYAIGFVRSYAEYLNLDGEEIVRRYKAEATGVGAKPSLVFPKPIPDSGVPGAALLGLGVIVAALAYGIWYWNSNGADVTIARVDPVPEHMAAVDEDSAPMSEEVASAASAPSVEADAAATPATDPVADEAPQEPQVEVAPLAAASGADGAAAPAAAPTAAEPTGVKPTGVEPTAAVVAAALEPAAPQATTPAAVPEVAAEVAAVAEPQKPVAEATTPTVAATNAVPSDESAATGSEGPSRITVRATANSWIQIRDEALNRLLFTRLLREGDQYEVPNRPGLSLMTGNAGALELLVDGQAIPSLGAVGEVRRNVVLDPDKLKSGTAVAE